MAVCSGIGNAVELLKQMKAGKAHYDFVEVWVGGERGDTSAEWEDE